MPSFTHVLLSAWLTASAADAASTVYAVHRGAREANPLLTAPWTLTLMKGVSTVGGVWWARQYEHDHPRLVRLVAIAAAGAYTAANVHNLRVAGAR